MKTVCGVLMSRGSPELTTLGDLVKGTAYVAAIRGW